MDYEILSLSVQYSSILSLIIISAISQLFTVKMKHPKRVHTLRGLLQNLLVLKTITGM